MLRARMGYRSDASIPEAEIGRRVDASRVVVIGNHFVKETECVQEGVQMTDDDIELGPIDYLVVEWPADRQPDGRRSRTSSTWSTGD